jgi:membrane-associated phospholipid phosphatase
MREDAPPSDTDISSELGAGQFADASHLPRLPRRSAALVLICAGLGFTLLAVWIGRHGGTQPAVDLVIHHWVVAHRGGAGVAVARTVRWAGTSEVVLGALFVVGLAASIRRGVLPRLNSALALTAIAGTGVAVEDGINTMIGRARPPVADWAGAAGGSSFPSGHTTVATLFALGCAWALASRVRPGWGRRLVFAAAGCYAVVVGWSRIWLGVHWPTDVLAGWLFGLTWSSAAIVVVSLVPVRRRRSPGLSPTTGASRSSSGPAECQTCASATNGTCNGR